MKTEGLTKYIEKYSNNNILRGIFLHCRCAFDNTLKLN